jgi:HK97 family phage major capsid protein
MSWQQIKQLKEERGQVLADMKSLLKKAEDEKRDLSAEEDGKFNEFNTRAEQIKTDLERRERIAQIERDAGDAKGNDETRTQPGREDTNRRSTEADEKAQEQRAQVQSYLRTGLLPPQEQRAVTVSGTGVVGDRIMYDELVKVMKSYSGVRAAGAFVIPSSDGNEFGIPTADDTSNEGQIVGEGATDNTEADPNLGSVTVKPVRFDSKWIKVSYELLQDASYNVEQYILNIAGERIGRAFNRFSTVGTGTGQPQGVVTAAGVGKTAASTSAIAYEELLDLQHSLDAAYRANPAFRFMLHDTTLAACRKLKDSSGRYIFAAGAAGAPSTLLDVGYQVNNHMPELSDGAGSKVILAGDFGRYTVRDVTNAVIIRASELFSGQGLIGFRLFSRHDGRVTDANAFKVLQLAAS